LKRVERKSKDERNTWLYVEELSRWSNLPISQVNEITQQMSKVWCYSMAKNGIHYNKAEFRLKAEESGIFCPPIS
jgi:hypothetical protein